MTRLAAWVYRALLLLLPRSFRREHGEESVALFRRTVRDARARGGSAAALGVAWRGWIGVLRGAVEEWWGRGGGMGMGNAVRQAVRSVVRDRGVNAGVVGLLALGLGATLTVLSVVDGVLLRRLPYPQPDRLAVVQDGAHSWPDFQDWTRTVPAFETLAAASGQTFTLTDDVPRDIEGARVSEHLLELLGARAERGRLPSGAEYREGRRVAVVGHDAWERRWGADPDLVGSTVSVDGAPVEVVGILAPDFQAPVALTGGGVELWVPVDPTDPDLTRHDRSFNVVGRLAPGASLDDAAAQLLERARDFAREFPDTYAEDDGSPRRTFSPETLAEATNGDARGPLLVLLAGATLLLLVACGNAGSLLLARGEARQGEFAARRALGGGHTAIVAQLLAEAVLLALGGGLLGLVLAVLGVDAVKALEPGRLPGMDHVALNLPMAGVGLAMAMVTGVVAGLVPAWRGARVAPASLLRRAQAGSRGRTRAMGGRWLVVGEAAMASLLLVGSLAVIRGLTGLMSLDPGFVPENAYAVGINVGRDATEDERAVNAARVRDRLAALPGVSVVGAGLTVPFQISGGNRCCWLGELVDRDREIDRAWVDPVVPGYFGALGIDFVAGGGFGAGDRSDGVVPIVLNETAAEQLFPDGDAVDRPLRFASIDLRVVGVIADVHHWGADQPVEPEFYLPYAPRGAWASGLTFVLRAAAPPAMEVVRSAVAEVAPRAVVDDLRPMTDVMGESWARFRFFALVLAFFAAAALVLACAGLAGTLLYEARLRHHEMGVRMALGAPVGRLVGRVLAGTFATVGAGAALGLLVYWPLHRYLDSVLPGVDPADPLALAAFAGLLLVTAVAAAWAPARLVRATEPTRALR